MLVLSPRSVEFGSETWPGVSAVAIDRRVTRSLVEWSDEGPHAAFADAPEVEVRVRVTQQLEEASADGPMAGASGSLSFVSAPGRSGARRRRVRVACVVMGVTHEVSERRAGVRTIELVGVSPDGGAADPVSVETAD
ncbi:MAG: hypothetical protein AAGK04_11680 [Planctomycetota bacterium]